MATSPLAAALKPTVGADEESEAIYNEALKQMAESLDSRKNRLFDPQLLALAQGFAAPTQTGSFFESIGNAAGAVNKAQAEEEKSQREEAAMKLQLAQSRREASLKQQAVKAMQGGAGGITKGDPSGAGVMVNGVEYTPLKIYQIGLQNPDLGKALESMYKLTLESVAVQPGGYVNKISGQYTPFGGKALVERNVPGVGTIKMPEQDAMELDAARTENNAQKYWSIVDKNSKPMAQPAAAAPAGAAPSPAGAIATGAGASGAVMPPTDERTTVASSEAAAAAQKKRAELTAEEETKRTQKYINAGADADQRISSAGVIKNLMSQEGMDQVVGVLEKPGLLPALFKTAEEGIAAGRGFGLSVPQVRDIYTQNKIVLPRAPGETADQYRAREEAVISRLQQLYSEFSKITFGFRSLAQGQGSISNLENQIFQMMGPTGRDSYQTIMAKTAHTIARAEADRKLASALSNSGIPFDKFSQTREYKNIIDSYDNQLRRIYGGVQVGNRPVIQNAITPQSLKDRL